MASGVAAGNVSGSVDSTGAYVPPTPGQPPVMRYTGQAASGPLATSQPVTAGTSVPPIPSSGPTTPLNSLLGDQQLTDPSINDEQTIRDSIAKSMQSQVDATNAYYNNYVGSTLTPAANNRLGQVAATDARSGTTGTDVDEANLAGTQTYNKQLLDQTEAERQQKLSDVTDQINTRTEQEVDARKQEALGNRGAYATYLTSQQEQARQNLKDIAANGGVLSSAQRDTLIRQTGYDPMTLDAIFNANKTQGTAISYNYTNLGNGTVLRTGKMANGQAVPEQKFQYALGPNDDFQVTQNGTPIIVTKNGDQITDVKVAPGFQSGDLADKFQVGTTYPGATNYKFNVLTGQYEPINASGSGSGSGGSLVSPKPNPAAVVNGYDLTSYASGNAVGGPASQAANVAATYGKLPNITDAASANAAIQSIKPSSPITGDMVMQAAQVTGVDPKMIISVMQAETQLGTDGSKGSQGNNFGNVGNTDSLMANGGSKSFSSPQDGVMAVAQNLASRQMGQNSGSTADKPYNASDPTDALARTWLQTGQQPPKGNGKTSPTAGAVESRGRELAMQFGLPADFDPATASASQKADVNSLVDLTDRQANTQASFTTLQSNAGLLLKGMQTAGINQNAPFLNELQNAANNKLIGSGDLVAYQNSLNTYRKEYSRLLQGKGASTDAGDASAQQALPDNISAANLGQVITRINAEAQNQLDGLNQEITQKKNDISGIGGSSSTSGGSAGFSVVAPDGKTYSFKDQASLDQFKQEAGIQ